MQHTPAVSSKEKRKLWMKDKKKQSWRKKRRVQPHFSLPIDYKDTPNFNCTVRSIDSLASGTTTLSGGHSLISLPEDVLATQSTLPNHPLWRFQHALNAEELQLLVSAVEQVKKAPGIRPSKSKTHDVHQFYLGIWPKYSSVAFMTAHSKPKNLKAQKAVDLLRATFDKSTRRLLHYLLQTDPITAKGLKEAHRSSHDVIAVLKNMLDSGEMDDKQYRQFRTSAEAIDKL